MAESDWDLREMADSARRSRLLGPVSPEKLRERLEAEAKEAAANNAVQIHWREADGQKGYWRIESAVPLTAETFDLFFNGRMGYRAQYYRSPDAGRTFNRSLVHRLIPAIRTARMYRLALMLKLEIKKFAYTMRKDVENGGSHQYCSEHGPSIVRFKGTPYPRFA